MIEDTVFNESPFSTETSSPTSSSNGSSSGRRGKKLLFLIILLVVLGLIAFGAVQLLGNQGESTPTPTPTESFEIPTDTPTPTPEEETTPTPEKEEKKATPTPTKKPAVTGTDQATGLDRADLSIIVQNGSGEAGVASTMKNKLEGLGYVVSSTGNADNFEYAQTVIRVKNSKADFLALLKKDLGSSYTIGTASADYTGSGDALVIVGKE